MNVLASCMFQLNTSLCSAQPFSMKVDWRSFFPPQNKHSSRMVSSRSSTEFEIAHALALLATVLCRSDKLGAMLLELSAGARFARNDNKMMIANDNMTEI